MVLELNFNIRKNAGIVSLDPTYDFYNPIKSNSLAEHQRT